MPVLLNALSDFIHMQVKILPFVAHVGYRSLFSVNLFIFFYLWLFYRIQTSRHRSLKFPGLLTSCLQWVQWPTERLVCQQWLLIVMSTMEGLCLAYCLSVSLCVCLSVWLSVWLSVCLKRMITPKVGDRLG